MDKIIFKTYNSIENISIKSIKKIDTMKDVDVSIIIRTRNEEKRIVECIEKILNQDGNYKMEIIIIDSESTDRTVDLAQKYDLDIYSISPKDFNFGTSIQLGIELSSGKYCTFVSAHAIPQNKLWLKNMIEKFDENTAAVYSKQIFDEDTFFIEKRALYETFGENYRFQKWNDNYKKYNDYRNEIIFSNASSCIRRKVALEYPFSRIIASEDREWSLRILKAGYNIIYNPESVIYHSHNESVEKYYKRIFINSKALYEFTGVKINFYHILPLILINIIKDIKFINKIEEKLTFSKIKTSIVYRYYYAKAHYLGTRKDI